MMPTQTRDSLLEFLNASAASAGDLVSFATGMPDAACINDYALDEMIGVFLDSRVGLGERPAALDLRQYGPTRGIITAHIQRYLENDHGIGVGTDRIIVTHGAQEALSLLTWSLLDPAHECLLVPDPCFPGCHETARRLGVEVIGFPCGPSVVDRAGLEAAMADAVRRGKRPGALYINPTYGNPLGGTLGHADREYLNDFAVWHDLWVFEDDPYALFAYERDTAVPLAALPGNTRTVFVGTFSKTIAPSLRIGFIAAPGADGRLIDHLSEAKSALSLQTSQICQAVVGGVLHESGYSLRNRCRESTRLYRRKRDELADALRETSAGGPGLRHARWSTPAGGFFMPLELSRPFLRRDLVALRDDFGVLVTPMSEFSVRGAWANALRLAFSAVPLDQIRPGVRRLGAYLSREA